MRITCPGCGAAYAVPDRAVPDPGRDVQCAACGASWFILKGGPASSGTAAPPEAPAPGRGPTPDGGPAPGGNPAQRGGTVRDPAPRPPAAGAQAAADDPHDTARHAPGDNPTQGGGPAPGGNPAQRGGTVRDPAPRPPAAGAQAAADDPHDTARHAPGDNPTQGGGPAPDGNPAQRGGTVRDPAPRPPAAVAQAAADDPHDTARHAPGGAGIAAGTSAPPAGPSLDTPPPAASPPTGSRPDAPPAHAPPPDAPPDAPPRPRVDPAVLAILRAEAETERRARQRDALARSASAATARAASDAATPRTPDAPAATGPARAAPRGTGAAHDRLARLTAAERQMAGPAPPRSGSALGARGDDADAGLVEDPDAGRHRPQPPLLGTPPAEGAGAGVPRPDGTLPVAAPPPRDAPLPVAVVSADRQALAVLRRRRRGFRLGFAATAGLCCAALGLYLAALHWGDRLDGPLAEAVLTRGAQVQATLVDWLRRVVVPALS